MKNKLAQLAITASDGKIFIYLHTCLCRYKTQGCNNIDTHDKMHGHVCKVFISFTLG